MQDGSHDLAVNGPPDNLVSDPRGIFVGASAWVLTDGKAGDEAPCLGLARAMGLSPKRRTVHPRRLFAALAPIGPIDPAERPNAPASPIAPPFPDVLIASGRRAIPYLRHVRRASGGRTFTIFLKDPRIGARVADIVWVPAHDTLRGANVLVSMAAPHLVSPLALRQARIEIDPRIGALPEPRVAMLLGGDSRHHSFVEKDRRTLVGALETILVSGASAMITPSRRTPPALVADLQRAAREAPQRVFIWDGGGDNPYVQMLAHASTIIVTSDSTNMVGEAIATNVPVMVYEPTGGHPKIASFVDSLVKAGRVRKWLGRLERWPCASMDSTDEIAREIGRRYADWRGRGSKA